MSAGPVTGSVGARTVGGMFRSVAKACVMLAAVGVLSGSVAASAVAEAPGLVGRYSTPDSAAALPPVRGGDEVCDGQVALDWPVSVVAWTEIRGLRDLGLPVCDVTWGFYALDAWWGMSYQDASGEVFIQIEANDAEYADSGDPDLAIRSVVRHEFGHAIVYEAGLQEAELRATFTDLLSWTDESTEPGNEVAATAIAAVLAAERNDEQWSVYVENVSAASIGAAEALVAASVGSGT